MINNIIYSHDSDAIQIEFHYIFTNTLQLDTTGYSIVACGKYTCLLAKPFIASFYPYYYGCTSTRCNRM